MPRNRGDNCDGCGHLKEQHNLDGRIGACKRVGCDCSGFLEELHSHTESVHTDFEVIMSISKRYKAHDGWRDRG